MKKPLIYERKRNFRGFPCLVLLSIIIFLLSSASAFPATVYWTGAVNNSWSEAGNWSGGTPSGQDVVFDAAHSQNATSTIDAEITIGSLTIPDWGGALTQSANLTIEKDISGDPDGSYTQQSGTFNGSSYTLTAQGDFSIAGGTFNAGRSTVILDATDNDLTLDAGGYTFNNLHFKNSSDTDERTLTISSGDYVVEDNLYIVICGSKELIIDAATNDPNFTIGGNLGVPSSFNLAPSATSVDVIQGDENCCSDGAEALRDGDTSTCAGVRGWGDDGIFQYEWDTAQTISVMKVYFIEHCWDEGAGNVGNYYFSYYDGGWQTPSEWVASTDTNGRDTWYSFALTTPVTTNKVQLYWPVTCPPAGVAEWEIGESFTPGADANINAGSGTWTIGGNADFTGVTFNVENGNTVIFNGTGTSTIYGPNTFYNLSYQTAGSTLKFEAGETQTVSNTLTLVGTYENPLILRSTSDGTQWNINMTGGTKNLYNIDVQDSNATGAALTAKGNSIVAGQNNTNWSKENYYWVGVDTSWNTAANWSNSPGGSGGAGVPGAGDYAIFDSNSTQDCTFDTDVSIAGLRVDGYVGIIDTTSIYTLTTTYELSLSSGAVTFNADGDVTVGTKFYQNAGTFTSSNTKDFSAQDFTLDGGTFTRYQGEGTEANPYLIYDVYSLQAIKCNLSSHYKLANDIDAIEAASWNSGAGFEPVGNSSNKFTGTLNGQSYIISNLTINRSSYVGLLGYTGSGASIENTGLVDVNITGSSSVGGLVGYNYEGSITSSYSTGSVTGDDQVGGLVGTNSGDITNSYSTGSVQGGGSTGGLAGTNGGDGDIDNSYSTSSIEGSSVYVGGLVGNNDGSIDNSYSTGSVTSSSWRVGGLVGNNNGDVNNSYATGNITSGQRQLHFPINDN